MTTKGASLTSGAQALAFAERWLSEHYPAIAGGLLFSDRSVTDAERAVAIRVLDLYLSRPDAEARPIVEGLEAFCRITFDFLRLQSRFMRTGKYHSNSAQRLREDLYLVSDKMRGYYLDGLFLTYALWPNHTRMLQFFEDKFLSLCADDSTLLEIGVGHGLMSTLALSRLTSACYTGVDISPSSLDVTHGLLSANHIDAGRYSLQQSDVTGDTEPAPPHSCDAAFCCEVLEHVEAPERILWALHRAMKPSASAYITTVANIEAEDHIYLFHDADEIRGLLHDCGFRIDYELSMPLRGMETANPVPLNYAAVLSPTGQ